MEVVCLVKVVDIIADINGKYLYKINLDMTLMVLKPS
jgi:hypothetical protein